MFPIYVYMMKNHCFIVVPSHQQTFLSERVFSHAYILSKLSMKLFTSTSIYIIITIMIHISFEIVTTYQGVLVTSRDINLDQKKPLMKRGFLRSEAIITTNLLYYVEATTQYGKEFRYL